MTRYQSLIEPICDLACAAGETIMQFYRSGDVNTQIKDDNSPVTDADLAAHRQIVDTLRQLTPEIPVVSEESRKLPDVSEDNVFWLVDPLDGTKSFIKRTDEFTVNIAMIEDGRPVFGVIYVPAKGDLYYGSEVFGAYKHAANDYPRKIAVREQPEEGATVVVSMSHLTPETEQFLETVEVADKVSASSSLKFCVVAEASADIYPRYGRTMEWDTAAGHAILLAAGGQMETTAGEPFTYGKPDFANPGFIARGKEPAEAEAES